MMKMGKYLWLWIFVGIIFFGCGGNGTEGEENSHEDGDLDKTFAEETQISDLKSEQKFEQEKEKLILDGWEEKQIENGQLPACYNFIPQKGKIDNFLEVYVGSGTDIAIKLMNLKTDKCVRYVFINSRSTYRIRNIPEGKYYLKIAYGKNWLSKVENGQCIGKFVRNPMYEKGEEIMDFHLHYVSDGYKVPSFKLELDVVSSGISNTFESQNISESEFNQ